MAISPSVNGSIAWQASSVHYTGAASTTLNVPSGAVGIASFAWQNNNFQAPATITDSSGNVWTRRINATSPLTSGGFNIKEAVYTSPIFPAADSAWAMAMVDASGSNFSLDNITTAVQFFAGFPAGSAQIDVAAFTGAIPSDPFTTTTAAQLLCYVAHGYGSDITPASGYTEGVDNTRLAIHYQEVSAVQTAATVSPGNCSAVAVVTFKAASAGPVITGLSVSGGTLTATGSCSVDQTGTLWRKADASSAATDPGAGNEAGAGWSSQTISATGSQSLNFGTLSSGTKYGHVFAVNGSGTRGSVVNSSSFVVTGGPTINTQPSNQTVTAPATATFTVSATASAGSLTYQWQRSTNSGGSWSNVSTGTGGTTASYTTPATSVSSGSANNGDQYRCQVSDSNGTVNTSAATLTVNASASYGFDFHTLSGFIFGEVVGSLTGLSRQTSVAMVARAYDTTTGALVATSGTLTTDGNGRLPRWTHASLANATTYALTFTRNSDGAIACAKAATT